MKLLVLGGTGGTGRHLVQQALDANHEVTVLVRDRARISTQHPRLQIVIGDASDTSAIAEAAKPVLGDFGFTLIVVTAIFSTMGAVNAGLYPSIGMTQHLASIGLFPAVFSRSVGRVPVGLLVMAALTIVQLFLLDLNAIASLGSAVALIVFSAVTIAHFRVYRETGANLAVLIVALATTVITFVVFCTTTLVEQPRTAVALVLIVALAAVLDVAWSRIRDRRQRASA